MAYGVARGCGDADVGLSFVISPERVCARVGPRLLCLANLERHRSQASWLASA